MYGEWGNPILVALFLMSIYYTLKYDKSQLKIFLTGTAKMGPEQKKKKKKRKRKEKEKQLSLY